MPIFSTDLPLSIYVHLPWCVKKCPYCDFNSHEQKGDIPEKRYVEVLISELEQHLSLIDGRNVNSIFFGGGTPSLFSPAAIGDILKGITKRIPLISTAEITLEANPGTADQTRFKGYKEVGVNRLSLGIQSLQNDKLQVLGRIHNYQHAINAIEFAYSAGFNNLNLDIMYGLPNQSIEDALSDIQLALSYQPTHFSWYQLTLEPNTFFYAKPPLLPHEETIFTIQQLGFTYLQQKGFTQYEVSAYAQPKRECAHNLNYWKFGDYLGLGAGAHSKITTPTQVLRSAQLKHPRDYLNQEKRQAQAWQSLKEKDLIFEFMLNALRLTQGFTPALFTARTGCALAAIAPYLEKAQRRKLLTINADCIRPSTLGKNFLNDLTAIFLN